jgi:hypothetical protein
MTFLATQIACRMQSKCNHHFHWMVQRVTCMRLVIMVRDTLPYGHAPTYQI